MSARLPPGYGVLGLRDATAGRAEVRRAYAARLKQIDPDQDRAAFERLRAAYEAALAFCASATQRPEGPEAELDRPLAPARAPEPLSVLRPAPEDTRLAQIEARLQAAVQRREEIDTIRQLLHDPALNDPALARQVEWGIYTIFQERIGIDPDGMPHFRFANRSGRGHTGDAAFGGDRKALIELLKALDTQLGWFSDSIRMQRTFPDFDRLAIAADALMPAPNWREWGRRTVSKNAGAVVLMSVIVLVLGIHFLLKSMNDTPPPVGSGAATTSIDDLSLPPALDPKPKTTVEDLHFIDAVPGALEPSFDTQHFLQELLEAQGLSDGSSPSSQLGMLRAVLQLRARGQARPHLLDLDPEGEGLSYLLGAMLAARFTIEQNLAYRDTAGFGFTLQPGSETVHWMQLYSEQPDPTLWRGTGGYVFSADGRVPSGVAPAYPLAFVEAMRQAAGGDARILEGALGLKFRTLADWPEARIFYFPQLGFPAFAPMPDALREHQLVGTGLDANRWPIRTVLPSGQPCRWPAAALLIDLSANARCP